MNKAIPNIKLALATLLIYIMSVSPSFANKQNMLGKLNNPYASEVNSLAQGPDNTVFAGTWGDGIYKSNDGGESFSASSNGLTTYNSKYINDIAFSSTEIYIATNGDGVYKSVDNGNTWTSASVGLRNLRVASVITSGASTVYASTKGDGVFKSTDGGATWFDFSEGLTFQDMGELYETDMGSLLVSTWGMGVFRIAKDSMDVGNYEWEMSSSGIYRLDDFSIYATSFNKDRTDKIYVGTLGKGVFSSEDDGYSWTGERTDELLDHNVTSFAFSEDDQKDNLVVGTRNWGCWYWVDNGPEQEFEPGLGTNFYGVNDLIRLNDDTYLAATTAGGIMKSTDKGLIWDPTEFANTGYNQAVSFKGNTIFASGDFDGLTYSKDFGLTWSVSLDLEDIEKVTRNNNNFAAISSSSFAISTDDGDNWVNKNIPSFHSDDGSWKVAERVFTDVEILQNNHIMVSYQIIYATQDDPPNPINPPVVPYGVLESTDNGDTWTNNESANSLDNFFVGVSSSSAAQRYAVANTDSIFISTNGGASWTSKIIDDTKSNLRLTGVDAFANRVLVGTWEGLYISTDKGQNFIEVPIDYIDTKTFGEVSKRVESINIESNTDYQVGFGKHSGVFFTTDAGNSWDSLNPSYEMSKIKAIATNDDGDKIYGGIGIFNWVNPENFLPPVLVSPANGVGDIAVNYPNEKGQEKPVLKWNKANKADMYEMQISSNELFSHVLAQYTFASRTWTTDFDFEYNHTYHWKVRSKTNDSYSPWSEVFTFTTELEMPELTYPIDGESCVKSSDTFTWLTSDGAETYDIEISEDVDFTDPIFSTLSDVANTFTSLDSTFDFSSTYFWRAKAKNSISTSPWTEPNMFTTAMAPPETLYPADSATQVETSLNFAFAAPDEADNVFIEIYRDEALTDGVIKTKTTEIDSFSTDLLEFNVCYWWRIKSTTTDGCESIWSDVAYFCTGIAAPQLFLPENGAVAQELDVKIRWNTFKDAEEYMYQVSKNKEFTDILQEGKTADKNTAIAGFENFTEYFWRVKVILDGQEGSWSDIWSFRTKMETIVTTKPLCDTDDVENVNLAFKWSDLTGATSYNLQVDDDISFNSPEIDVTGLTDNEYNSKTGDLDSNMTYYWRVQGANADSTNDWTEPCKFKTMPKTSVEDDIALNLQTSAYPNPFDKTTNIEYTLIKPTHLKIKVYNMTGLMVADLLDTTKPAGIHTLEWSPEKLPAGAYYYQIQIGATIITKELILTK